MAIKEKGCPLEGSPNLKIVRADNSEFKASSIDLQVSRLTRRFALSIPVAIVLAGLAYDCGRDAR